jgi:hypothetical protein
MNTHQKPRVRYHLIGDYWTWTNPDGTTGASDMWEDVARSHSSAPGRGVARRSGSREQITHLFCTASPVVNGPSANGSLPAERGAS